MSPSALPLSLYLSLCLSLLLPFFRVAEAERVFVPVESIMKWMLGSPTYQYQCMHTHTHTHTHTMRSRDGERKSCSKISLKANLQCGKCLYSLPSHRSHIRTSLSQHTTTQLLNEIRMKFLQEHEACSYEINFHSDGDRQKRAVVSIKRLVSPITCCSYVREYCSHTLQLGKGRKDERKFRNYF